MSPDTDCILCGEPVPGFAPPSRTGRLPSGGDPVFAPRTRPVHDACAAAEGGAQ